MTKQADELVRKLKNLKPTVVQVETADVVEVNEGEMTCTVQTADETVIDEVRLKAAIDEVSDGIVQFPEVGSTVLVGMIGNDTNTRFVVAFSKVTKVIINGGEKGGLINIQTLIEELDKTNAVVNAIVDTLKNWTPVANDGGAALKAFFPTMLLDKEVGDFTDMEDDKVKH